MTRIRADYKGIGDMLKSHAMKELLRSYAEDIERDAIATAPVYTGRYKSSFEVDTGLTAEVPPRAYARVRNTSDHSLDVEFGRDDTPRYRTLGKALWKYRG